MKITYRGILWTELLELIGWCHYIISIYLSDYLPVSYGHISPITKKFLLCMHLDFGYFWCDHVWTVQLCTASSDEEQLYDQIPVGFTAPASALGFPVWGYIYNGASWMCVRLAIKERQRWSRSRRSHYSTRNRYLVFTKIYVLFLVCQLWEHSLALELCVDGVWIKIYVWIEIKIFMQVLFFRIKYIHERGWR